MDKVLSVQHLSVLDLLDPAEVSKRATILPPSGDEFENVLLTDASIAATQPLIASMHVKDILKFKKSFLRKLKAGNRRRPFRLAALRAHQSSTPGTRSPCIPGSCPAPRC